MSTDTAGDFYQGYSNAIKLNYKSLVDLHVMCADWGEQMSLL